MSAALGPDSPTKAEVEMTDAATSAQAAAIAAVFLARVHVSVPFMRGT
jgi:hypothetical protein